MIRRTGWAESPALRRVPFLLPGRRILIQCTGEFLETIPAGRIDFFQTVEALAKERGLPVSLFRHAPASLRLARRSRHLNLLVGAPSSPGRHVLHVCPTYVRGFWYVDRQGERHESSIGAARFDPDDVPASGAARLVRRLRQRIVANNRTKYPQAERGSRPVPEGCIALFAQEFGTGATDICHFTLRGFVEAIMRHRGTRPLCIKPHPLQSDETRAWLMGLHDPDQGIHVTDASLHDLLHACAFTASLTSAASFEGFLHGKPAILGGRTDFHHNAITATDETGLARAMAAITRQDFAYERYLFWFLRRHCLAPAHDDFADRLVTRIAETGFPFDTIR